MRIASLSRRRQRGFNLIELLVVLTVSAIMLGIATPSFREFVATQRVKNTAFDFASALLLARSEAIKRNGPVTLAQTGASWAGGWTVNAGGTPLETKEVATGVTITPVPDTTSFDFQGNGRIASTLRFQFEGENTSSVRCVTISVSGVPNTISGSCS